MDESNNSPPKGKRAGIFTKLVVVLALIHLGFAGGIFFNIWYKQQGLKDEKAGGRNVQTSFDPDQEVLINSIGAKLTKTDSGVWIAESPVTPEQYRQVTGVQTGSALANEASGATDAASYLTWEQAAAFCRILTDAERAAGNLPDNLSYRLPEMDELEKLDPVSDEWIQQDTASGNVAIAEAVLSLDVSRYAPGADLSPGGWLRWHANLVAGPEGALSLPKNVSPKLEFSGKLDGAHRVLTIRATGESDQEAIGLAAEVVKSIKTTCNAIAEKNREDDLRRFRSMLKTEESLNARERSALLDLMARYDIRDTLDLPSWFQPRGELHEDLGIQNAKNDIASLEAFLTILDGLKEGEMPVIPTSPAPPDSASTYLRLHAQRELLKVKWDQQKVTDPDESQQDTIGLRKRIEDNRQELAIAKKSLAEDVGRELEVLKKLLGELESAKLLPRLEPPKPSPDQPRHEATLESRISFHGEQLEKLSNLAGDILFDFAVRRSQPENPLHALVPDYKKSRDLAAELELVLAELEETRKALAESPLDPNGEKAPDGAPDTEAEGPEESDKEQPEEGGSDPDPSPPKAEPVDPEAEAKKKEEEERIAKLKAERETKLKEMDTEIEQKREAIDKAKSDSQIAEAAIRKEIENLKNSLANSIKDDRQELEYLAAKRGYLVGWQRLIDLKAKVSSLKDSAGAVPDAVTVVTEPRLLQETPSPPKAIEKFFHEGELVSARHGYSARDLHFRLVLDSVGD